MKRVHPHCTCTPLYPLTVHPQRQRVNVLHVDYSSTYPARGAHRRHAHRTRRASRRSPSSLHRQVITTGGLICIHQGHHRVRNQGECYSSLSADSVLTQPRLWDCSLFFSPVGWPRVPRTSIAAGACIPFPSVHLPHPAVSIGIPDTPSPDTSPQFPESSKS